MASNSSFLPRDPGGHLSPGHPYTSPQMGYPVQDLASASVRHCTAPVGRPVNHDPPRRHASDIHAGYPHHSGGVTHPPHIGGIARSYSTDCPPESIQQPYSFPEVSPRGDHPSKLFSSLNSNKAAARTGSNSTGNTLSAGAEPSKTNPLYSKSPSSPSSYSADPSARAYDPQSKHPSSLGSHGVDPSARARAYNPQSKPSSLGSHVDPSAYGAQSKPSLGSHGVDPAYDPQSKHPSALGSHGVDPSARACNPQSKHPSLGSHGVDPSAYDPQSKHPSSLGSHGVDPSARAYDSQSIPPPSYGPGPSRTSPPYDTGLGPTDRTSESQFRPPSSHSPPHDSTDSSYQHPTSTGSYSVELSDKTGSLYDSRSKPPTTTTTSHSVDHPSVYSSYQHPTSAGSSHLHDYQLKTSYGDVPSSSLPELHQHQHHFDIASQPHSPSSLTSQPYPHEVRQQPGYPPSAEDPSRTHSQRVQELGRGGVNAQDVPVGRGRGVAPGSSHRGSGGEASAEYHQGEGGGRGVAPGSSHRGRGGGMSAEYLHHQGEGRGGAHQGGSREGEGMGMTRRQSDRPQTRSQSDWALQVPDSAHHRHDLRSSLSSNAIPQPHYPLAVSHAPRIPSGRCCSMATLENERYSLDGISGPDHENEDRYFAIEGHNYKVFAIFDGHDGARAAGFACSYMHQVFDMPSWTSVVDRQNPGIVCEALGELFKDTEKEFFQSIQRFILEKESLQRLIPQHLSSYAAFQQFPNEVTRLQEVEPKLTGGCTAVLAVVVSDRLYVANVGDSRALLIRELPNKTLTVDQLSVDHSVENEDELKRLEALGLDPKELIKSGRLGMHENVRSIGDYSIKQGYRDVDTLRAAHSAPGIATPYIMPTGTVDHTYKYLVLMTDGVYKSIESGFDHQEAIESNKVLANMLQSSLDRRQGEFDRLSDSALERICKIHRDTYERNARQDPRSPKAIACRKRDDMTLLVYKFPESR